MKQVNVSQFKDFVVSEPSYHVNEKLIGIQTVSGVCSDKINISGELKITGFGKTDDDSPCLHAQGMGVELPTGDEIFIPVSYHPWIKSDQDSFPVFIYDKHELRWNKDLVAGGFYIMLNRYGERELILIKSIISNDKIEYISCDSRYNDKCGYFVESVKHELMLVYATKCKFISLKDIT
jgi:hypothetical protein